MDSPTCLCRAILDRDGQPHIARHDHCPVRGTQAPRCEDMSSKEFSAYVSRSINTVVRWARSGHEAARWCPYRKEYRWLPDVYRKTLEKSTVKPVQPVKKQRGRKPRFAALSGGQG